MRSVDRRDGGLITLSLFLLAILILTTKYYKAAILVEKNRTSLFYGDGGQLDDDYYYSGDDVELEALTDSYIGRMLAGSNGKSTTGFTLKANQTPCGKKRNIPYRRCMGNNKAAQNCHTTTRDCKKKKK